MSDTTEDQADEVLAEQASLSMTRTVHAAIRRAIFIATLIDAHIPSQAAHDRYDRELRSWREGRGASSGFLGAEWVAAACARDALGSIGQQLLLAGGVDWNQVAGTEPAAGFYWARTLAGIEPPEVIEINGWEAHSVGRPETYHREDFILLSPRLQVPEQIRPVDPVTGPPAFPASADNPLPSPQSAR